MTYPFTAPADAPLYVGALPDADPYWDVRSHRFWLGDPAFGYGMIELPSPDPSAYTPAQTRGRVPHGLANNTTAVTRFAGATRNWSIAWQRLAGRDWDVVGGFDAGLFGDGPWCFVPPEDRNRLTAAQASCGQLHGVVEGWTSTSAPVFQPTVAPWVIPSGVMQWTPPSNGSTLVATFDPHYSPPNLPAMPATFYAWCRTVSGTANVSARLSGRRGDGSIVVEQTGTVTTIGTAWQPVYITAGPAQLGASTYLAPTLLAASTTPLLISCAGFDYRDYLPDWCAGRGVPRVVQPADLDLTADMHLNRAVTMTLAEAWSGAA